MERAPALGRSRHVGLSEAAAEAEARITPRLLDALYTEAMLLADEARAYFDEAGREERDALEPFIDAQTMQIHHGKHHQAYVNNLNAALESQPDLQKKSIEQLLQNDLARYRF